MWCAPAPIRSDSALSTSEQLLLQRCSVFVGGWTLEAAEAVCADESLAAEDVAPAMQSLLDKSLVYVEDEDRYEEASNIPPGAS